MTLTVIIAALAMGFVFGLLGGGGSILAVPILMYLVGLPDKAAIATSLLVVGATGMVAAISHARAGNVDWRAGGIFGGASMGAAFLGGNLAGGIPGEILVAGFAVIMLLSAVMMLRKGKKPVVAVDEAGKESISSGKLAGLGVGVGLLSGLVGAGGGFVIVPALVIFGGISMHLAIGTSLAIIALKSIAGFAGYAVQGVQVDYAIAASFAVASFIGTFGGAAVAQRVDASKLQTGFAYFVLIAGALILGDKLDWPMAVNLAMAVGVSAIAAAARYLGSRRSAKDSVTAP